MILTDFVCFAGTRLKFGEGFQYALNAKGSTPTEVMGIDNKSTLKPSLDSFADELKTNSVAKFEELINLRQQSSVIAAKVEGKKNRLAKIDSHIDEVSALSSLVILKFVSFSGVDIWQVNS